MRIGIGYDIHRFDHARRPLKLGGVLVASSRGLAGHSDADVVLHAVADALLGAIGAPDLGELFPSTDPRYAGRDSRWFIRQVYARVQRGGWRVGNVDTTVITDAPHLSRYKDQMRRTMSGLLHVAPSAVSVKAKTTEGLPPGRRGIAAHAVVLLKKAQKKSVHSPRSTVHRTR